MKKSEEELRRVKKKDLFSAVKFLGGTSSKGRAQLNARPDLLGGAS